MSLDCEQSIRDDLVYDDGEDFGGESVFSRSCVYEVCQDSSADEGLSWTLTGCLRFLGSLKANIWMRCILACQFLPSVIASVFLGFQISVAFAATCLFCAAQRITGVYGRSAHTFHCQQVCRLPCAVSLNEISQLLLVPGIFLLVCLACIPGDSRYM